MMRFPLVGLLLLLAPAACGGEEDPLPTAELQVGGSLDGISFADVADGDDVELVPGAQGGFHVWISMRVHGAAGSLLVEREARRVSDGALILAAVARPVDIPGDAMEGWWESPEAAPAFMCPSPIGIQVFDQEIEYTVRLVDETEAVVAEGGVALVPHCPDGDQHDFCVEICSG